MWLISLDWQDATGSDWYNLQFTSLKIKLFVLIPPIFILVENWKWFDSWIQKLNLYFEKSKLNKLV